MCRARSGARPQDRAVSAGVASRVRLDSLGAGEVTEDVVKKLIILAAVALGVAAVWRKVQADRAELDLWTEATTADE